MTMKIPMQMAKAIPPRVPLMMAPTFGWDLGPFLRFGVSVEVYKTPVVCDDDWGFSMVSADVCRAFGFCEDTVALSRLSSLPLD